MKNVPEKIYLQVGEETESTDDFNELCKYGDITWWKERIFKSDIEYQHTDELDRLRAQNAELVAIFKKHESRIRYAHEIYSEFTIYGEDLEEILTALAKYEESLASQDAGQH